MNISSPAHAIAVEFLPRAREIRDPQVLVPAVAVASLIEHARGNQSAAVRLIEELEEVNRGRAVFRARHLPEALRVCVAAGALRLGESLLETSGHAAARHRHSVLAGRAVLTEARGREEEASALYAEAAGYLQVLDPVPGGRPTGGGSTDVRCPPGRTPARRRRSDRSPLTWPKSAAS